MHHFRSFTGTLFISPQKYTFSLKQQIFGADFLENHP